MASEAAERILAAYTGRTKSAARQAAGRKGATKAAWKRTVGSKVNWNAGNPYWDLSTSAWPKAKAGVNPWTTAVKSKLGRGATTSAGKAASAGGAPDLKIWDLLKNPKVDAGLAAAMLMYSALGEVGIQMREAKEAQLQRALIESQANMITPDAIAVNDAYERSRLQEASMLSALMQKLSGGGVLGPSLAQGEYSIGG